MRKKTQSEKFADLLYSNPEFQKAVIIIRRRFGIPDPGFIKKDDRAEFIKKFSKESLSKASDPLLISRVRKLRQDYEAGKISRQKYLFTVRELEWVVPQFRIDREIKNLRAEFKISNHWDFVLLSHIISGEKHWSQSCVPGIFLIGDGPEAEIKITIDANATQKELLDIWPTIQEFQKRLPNYRGGKLRKLKNLERDSRIVEMRAKGMKDREITEEINRLYKGTPVSYEYVPKILKRYKVRTGH
ncbi:MAG: hypothetical protein Q7S83_00395 [bacterium]|nr:hypothetical protein [bacterium]